MDKEQKTLKSPLSAKLEEVKAKAAGEAQKSLAREVLSSLEIIESQIILAYTGEITKLKDLLKQIIG